MVITESLPSLLVAISQSMEARSFPRESGQQDCKSGAFKTSVLNSATNSGNFNHLYTKIRFEDF